VVNANPRIIESNYSYILGKIGFNNPGYQQVVFPFNMFNQSFQQFVLLPGIQWQHSIFYRSPQQCSVGSPQATDASRMPLEAREQCPAFSRNRSYMHFSVVYRSSVCQALFSLLPRGRTQPFGDKPRGDAHSYGEGSGIDSRLWTTELRAEASPREPLGPGKRLVPQSSAW
jgi:hypothetical protein